MCMDFAPGLVKVTLRLGLVTFPRSCPHRFALRWSHFTHSILPVTGVFWCWPPRAWYTKQIIATSKQRISHWVRDAISLAYEAQNLPSPLSLRAHSTSGVASSQALFRGVPLEDICVAAGWSSPHTFVRFYNLDIDTAPGSQILSVWTDRMLLVLYWTR